MPVSQTAYDDSFRTLLHDCSELILPVVNEAFGEHYTGTEKIVFTSNDYFINQDNGDAEKRITDSNFIVIDSDGTKKRYHIECESNLDNTILLRMFEYDAQIALGDGKVVGTTVTVSFPHSAIMALRYAEKTPDTMRINVVTPGGATGYDVPVIKVQRYGLEEIFQRKLLFFLPFYIFSHEKHLPEYEHDEVKLQQLAGEYRTIRSKLEALQELGELDAFEKYAICSMISHVLALIAKKYQRVREGVDHTMRGKIIDYEAKTIRNAGFADGFADGRVDTIFDNIRALIAKMGLSRDEAFDVLNVSPEDRAIVAARL